MASGVLSAMTRFLCRGSFMSRLSWCVCKWQTWPAGPDQLKPLGTALLRHESQMQLSAQPEGTDRYASKTRGTMPCSVRDRRLPPATRCTLRQCAPGLRPSAQPGSEAPAAQVCAVNGLGGTFLPPWEHRAHQRRRVPWAAAPPLGRDTLCGRESSHGNWTQGPARSAATLAVSYRPSSVSHPGVSCLLPAPATPAGRPARSPAGRGDPRATQHLSAAQACRTLLPVPDAPGPSRGHPRPHEGCRGTWPGQQGPCVSRVPAALHTETTHRDLPGKARCCMAAAGHQGPGHVTWPPASTVAQAVSSPIPGQPALTCRHTATHGALPGPRLCLHLATS